MVLGGKIKHILEVKLWDGKMAIFKGVDTNPSGIRDFENMLNVYSGYLDNVIMTDMNACLGSGKNNYDLMLKVIKNYPKIKWYVRPANILTVQNAAKWYDVENVEAVIVDQILGSSVRLVHDLVTRYPETIFAFDFMPKRGSEYFCYYNKGIRVTDIKIEDMADDVHESVNIMVTNRAKAGSCEGAWSPPKFWGLYCSAWYSGGIQFPLVEGDELGRKGYDGIVVSTSIMRSPNLIYNFK